MHLPWELSGGTRPFLGKLAQAFHDYEYELFLNNGGSHFNHGQHFTLPS